MSGSRWRKIALLLGSTVVSLLLAEAGLRIFLRVKGEPYDGAALSAELERNADTVGAFTPADPDAPDAENRVLHPYFGAENGSDPGGVLEHFAKTAPDAEFEVLVVGGSVAALFCMDAGAELERALAADARILGRKVRVLDGAHAAYKQPQQLNKVAYLFALGYRPDVVVNFDGFNEVANGLNNGLSGTHPLFPSPPVWAGLLWKRSKLDAQRAREVSKLTELGDSYRSILAAAKRFGILHSALGGTWTRARLGTIQAQRAALQSELTEESASGKPRVRNLELDGDSYDRDEQAIVDLSVKNWIECSISLRALCAARGVHYLHALQPTLWDAGAKPIAEKERDLTGARHWRRGVELGYPKLRDSIPQLQAAGVSTLDLSRSFAEVEAPLYFDPCHYAPEGSKLLVDDFAREILAFLR